MTYPCCLLRAVPSFTTFLLLLAGPVYAGERCGLGPAGPHDREYLTQCRPEAVTATEKEEVVATLPSDGAVTELRSGERAKIDAVTAVLRFHRRDTVYEVRVIDVPQAWTGLHGRAVLLISRPALDLLSAAELQALTAHEIGHEYLWAGWEAAREADDNVRLREVESACDAIAALTLKELGIPPARLGSAIEKVFAYNRARFGVAGNERSYPTPKERRRLVAKFNAKRHQLTELVRGRPDGRPADGASRFPSYVYTTRSRVPGGHVEGRHVGTGGSGDWTNVQIRDPYTRDAAVRALTGAARWLERDRCQSIFEVFRDEHGVPLGDRLRALQMTPVSYLRAVSLLDGERRRPCSRHGVLAFTARHSRTIYVCGREFERLSRRNLREAQATIIHELLHTLGLGENPPSPRSITREVEERCWQ